MKSFFLMLSFMLIAGLTFGQKKATPSKAIPLKEEKKSLPKRMYKTWMKAKAIDENSSLSSRLINSIFKSIRSDKEE